MRNSKKLIVVADDDREIREVLSLALMFLIRNKVVRYVAMGVALSAAAAAAFFGIMVGVTGAFLGQLAVALLAVALIVASVVLGILGESVPSCFWSHASWPPRLS